MMLCGRSALTDADGAENETYLTAFTDHFAIMMDSIGAPAAWEQVLFSGLPAETNDQLLFAVEAVVGEATARELGQIVVSPDLFGEIVVVSRVWDGEDQWFDF